VVEEDEELEMWWVVLAEGDEAPPGAEELMVDLV
jgi:hypothetical protein